MARASPNGTTNHYRRLILFFAFGVVAGAALTYSGAVYWNTRGHIKLASRKSDLRVLRASLVACAKENGQYPNGLSGIIRELSLENRMDEEEFVYLVPGKEYNETAPYTVLFVEYRPRTYGFVSGYYVALQDSECFCLVKGPSLGL